MRITTALMKGHGEIMVLESKIWDKKWWEGSSRVVLDHEGPRCLGKELRLILVGNIMGFT